MKEKGKKAKVIGDETADQEKAREAHLQEKLEMAQDADHREHALRLRSQQVEHRHVDWPQADARKEGRPLPQSHDMQANQLRRQVGPMRRLCGCTTQNVMGITPISTATR